MGRLVTAPIAVALEKAAGNALFLVVTVFVAGWVYQQNKGRIKAAAVNATKAPTKLATGVIDAVSRSYDKAPSGYTHRTGSAAWLANLGSGKPLLPTQQGSWQPLPADKITRSIPDDVPDLDSVWVSSKTPVVVEPWYKRFFGD